MFRTHEKKPKVGEEVIFYYDDMFHIGYLVNDYGSDKPRKWEWVSYLKDYSIIQDLVEFWNELPECPK